MHLAAKAFLEDICPNPARVKSKSKGQLKGEDEDEDDEDWVHAMELEEPALEGEEVDEVEEFEPGDLLGKVLALITQVSLFFVASDDLTYVYRSIFRPKQRHTLPLFARRRA